MEWSAPYSIEGVITSGVPDHDEHRKGYGNRSRQELVSRGGNRSRWKAGFAKQARTIATGGVGGPVADLPGCDGVVSGIAALGTSICSPRP
jgi:hypothetical protein